MFEISFSYGIATGHAISHLNMFDRFDDSPRIMQFIIWDI